MKDIKYTRVMFHEKIWLIPSKHITPAFMEAYEKVTYGNKNMMPPIDFKYEEYIALTEALYDTNTIADL